MTEFFWGEPNNNKKSDELKPKSVPERSLVLKNNTVHTRICDMIDLTDNITKLKIKTSCCAFPLQLNTHGQHMMFGSKQRP